MWQIFDFFETFDKYWFLAFSQGQWAFCRISDLVFNEKKRQSAAKVVFFWTSIHEILYKNIKWDFPNEELATLIICHYNYNYFLATLITFLTRVILYHHNSTCEIMKNGGGGCSERKVTQTNQKSNSQGESHQPRNLKWTSNCLYSPKYFILVAKLRELRCSALRRLSNGCTKGYTNGFTELPCWKVFRGLGQKQEHFFSRLLLNPQWKLGQNDLHIKLK